MSQSTPYRPTGEGPQWFVEFLMYPPTWFKALVFLVGAIFVVLVARRLHRRDYYIGLDENTEMVVIVATTEAVAFGVLLASNATDWPYYASIVIGCIGGFVVVDLLRIVAGWVAADVETRVGLLVAWTLLGVLGFTLPELLAFNDEGYRRGLDMAFGTIAFGMFLWTLLQEWGPGETLGEAARANADADE